MVFLSSAQKHGIMAGEIHDYYDVFLGSGFTFIDLKVRHWMEAREVLHQ